MAGVVTRYVYDGEDILLEFDGVNVLLARYTHGPGIDEPLVMERDLNANGIFEATERFAYHTDGLGSVTELTDSTGTVVRAYVYDAYGQIVTETGALENPYTFTGREFDEESGLYFYRARYYDPKAGRFLSEDKLYLAAVIGSAFGQLNDGIINRNILGTPLFLNLYQYTNNNPTGRFDPFGLTYYDANLTIGFIIGVTAGVMITPEGLLYPYYGFGATLVPGIGGSFTRSAQDPIRGFGPTLTGGAGGLGGQIGFTQPEGGPDPSVPVGPGSFFIEGGFMTPGLSVMIQFVRGPISLPFLPCLLHLR